MSSDQLDRAVSGRLLDTFRRAEGPRIRERGGDALSIHLPRLPAALGLLRQELRKWLERRGVGRDDTVEIVLASSEACANAMEHPRDVVRAAIEVDARARPREVEIVVRDFGSWTSPEAAPEADTRGRGLAMIRALMDDVKVVAGPHGTSVTMRRRLAS
jgi:serine/threonine-protein kinase RsbW